MKRFLVTVCLLLLAAGASAQDVKPFNLYLGVGGSLPMGDFGDQYGLGLHAKAGVGFKVAPMFDIIPTLEFHAFSPDEDYWNDLLEIDDVDGGNLRLLMFGVDGRFSFGAPLAPAKPFVQGGAGFANISFSDFEGTGLTGDNAPEGETKFYFGVGGGLDFSLGEVLNAFVLARYVGISTEGDMTNMIPITVGLRF